MLRQTARCTECGKRVTGRRGHRLRADAGEPDALRALGAIEELRLSRSTRWNSIACSLDAERPQLIAINLPVSHLAKNTNSVTGDFSTPFEAPSDEC